MKKLFAKLKMACAVMITILLIAVLPSQIVKAQDPATDATMVALLQAIAQSTSSILDKVNNLPDYLTTITQFATSFMAADADSMKTEQSDFATLASDAMTAETTQVSLQPQLMKDFFGTNIDPSILPQINDLAYSTLLGAPLLNPDPRQVQKVDPIYNYLLNVSSLGTPMVVPNSGWRGDQNSQVTYRNLYNTITSVQTFNGYLLTRLYDDAKSGDSGTRQDLINQSSSSDWFSQVASNDLGWVLRQILIYNSQLYVAMDQLLQVQKQLLAAQAMSNTLLITQNQMTGNILLQKARGS